MEKSERFLVDTNIFIWWMKEDKILKRELKEILENPHFHIFLSIASIWEMVIKKKIGKLKLPRNWKVTLKHSRFIILPLELNHLFMLDTLPLYHKDPFDRVLVAQTKAEGLTIVTKDPKIKKYKIRIVG